MATPSDIDRLTDLFKQIWTMQKEMRMAQLMYVLTDPGFNHDKNMFFTPDVDFEGKLKKILETKKIDL
jgi:hypothetical protein